MKENSIEEDMKIVEQIKDIFLHLKFHGWINDIKRDIDTDKAIKAIDRILSDYKRVLKENEEWREAYQEEKDKQFKLIQNTNNTIKTANIAIKDLQEKLKEVIPVQKVKDKIAELEEEYEYLAEENQRVNKFEIELLQELLEGRK